MFPGLSFLSLRKRVRRDLEQTGNGYIEVLRNLEGQIIFLRCVPSRTVRILRLDAPVVVQKTVERDGQPFTVPTMIRERRYAQMIGPTFIYFREFGASRQVDAGNGWWESEEHPVSPLSRGTEIIHLKVHEHYFTPYGLPRWEGQIPSILGSRRAEEYNLDYFETGGLPPALITIMGGAMTEEARRALEDQFNSKTRSKHRIAILEAQATGGSLDAAGKVDVKVEGFGAERMTDALFQGYDEKCHQRVRRAFRLPPIFVGEVEGMTFASAYTAYLVAENQVFRPEREEFDDMVTRFLLPDLGGQGYVFRSRNVSITDIQSKLVALQVAGATQRIDPKDMVKAVNEVADLDLVAQDHEVLAPGQATQMMMQDRQQAMQAKAQQQAGGSNDNQGKPGSGSNFNMQANMGASAFKPEKTATVSVSVPKTGSGLVKADGYSVLSMADDAMLALRKRDLGALTRIVHGVDQMSPDLQQQFKAAMALRSYFDPSIDPEGMTELAGCSLMAMMRSGALD